MATVVVKVVGIIWERKKKDAAKPRRHKTARPPARTTYGSLNGQAVPVFKAYFNIRGKGPYEVMIPRAGFTPDALIDAIHAEARKIIAVMDAFA